jgi:hypothetical protein
MAKRSKMGFLKIIIFFGIIYFILSYFGISIDQASAFLRNIFNDALQLIK